MDKPTNPPGPNSLDSHWPEDSGSGQSFGATGIFGTVSAPEAAKKNPSLSPEPDPLAKWLSESQKPQPATPQPAPPPAAKDLAEPVVHKVVFGGGAAESSTQLLDRMRLASVERSAAEKPAEAGSGGFTELLRTLGSEPAASPVAPAPAPAPAPALVQNSGFTSLLSTLETTSQPVEETYKPMPQPSAPVSGGFTELLRADSAEAGKFSSAAPPAWSAPAPSAPLPSEAKPGAFTQMFGTFSATPEPTNAPPSAAGSFTRMLSIEQQTAPAPAFEEVRGPLPGPVDYGQAPQAQSVAPNRDPFASTPLPEQPAPIATGGSGMGITRLIQMLDEPAKTPAPQFEPAPMRPPSAPEPGEWTRTFASLSQSNEAPALPKAPEWTPTQPAYSAAQPAAELVMNKQAAAAAPSEFTRILDASRIREAAMKGGAGAVPPASPQSFAAAPPAMPNFQMPAPPPMTGGMPHAPAFTPPQAPPVPSYPMNFGSPAGGASQMGGMSQMHMPPAPIPPVSPLPAVKPPDVAAGKTQQLLLIMGVVIIVLLVAILVTVIFLMKH